MKIEIEIPDWADERHIYIMAGIELVAYKLLYEPWHVKTARCIMCGACCMNLKLSYFPMTGGTCDHLLEPLGDGVRECGQGATRPFICSAGMQRKGDKDRPKCTVEYEEVK
jgi:hypothetical protein